MSVFQQFIEEENSHFLLSVDIFKMRLIFFSIHFKNVSTKNKKNNKNKILRT